VGYIRMNKQGQADDVGIRQTHWGLSHNTMFITENEEENK